MASSVEAAATEGNDACWRQLGAFLAPEDAAWLRRHWDAAAVAEEDDPPPLQGLFDDEADGGSGAALQELAALLGTLSPPRGPELVPRAFRGGSGVSVHQVGDLRLATVRGGHKGHGDVLWGPAQYAAELLEETAASCPSADEPRSAVRRLLGGRPSLRGLRVLELGAGLALPSWVAFRRGARVVASDLSDPERLTAMATAAALNAPTSADGASDVAALGEAHVRAHNWGEPCDNLTGLLGGFDLILLCDCLYITDLHGALLKSIKACLAPDGVALVAFALHHDGNREAVFNFFVMAEAGGLRVEELEERQMPVRCSNMPESRFYVYARLLSLADGAGAAAR